MTPILFDKSSGNFHMLPKNMPDVEKAIQGIENKREKIEAALEDALKENENLKGRYKVNKRCGKGRSAVLKDTGMIHAFDYIRVEGDKGEKYDIMFSRFFISDDNSVNCKLCAYQFGFSEKTMSSYLLYPKSCEAKEKGSLELNYEYYNPIITYMEDGSDIDMLVNEFLDYIKRKSSRDVKNDLRNE